MSQDDHALLDHPEMLRDHWIRAVTLEEVAPDEFAPEVHHREFRVFGGRLMGSALMAACRTAPAEMVPHHLSATFYRPGKGELPMRYVVARSRDGRSFADRRVKAVQDGALLCEVSVGFGHAFDGLTYAPPMPDVPAPDAVEEFDWDQITPPQFRGLPRAELIRHFGPDEFYIERRQRPFVRGRGLPPPPLWGWFRMTAPLPADMALHAAALAWSSDGQIFAVVSHQIERPLGSIGAASLNHAIWWHAPPRFDGWILDVVEAHAAYADRGVQHGRSYAEDGTLLASVVQETLFPTRA